MKSELDIHPNPKQYLAWLALQDPKIADIHYGGAAGGGKTWLGSESRLARAIAYPGYKSFIGRNELTRLMSTCYLTFQKVLNYHEFPRDDWKLNGKYNYIEFRNGSRIDLIDLSFKPSDPMYERLGSSEYTDGWIDEAGEVPFMAVDILQSRVGRHMNAEFGLNPDTLYTYNPNKGWVYRVYKQWKDGILPEDTVFIQALYTDNPHTEDIYGRQLRRIKDPAMRARLMQGSFEYDADPASLIDYDAILDIFSNTVTGNDRYLTADIARHGTNYTVFYLWKGWTIYGVRIYGKQDTLITSQKLRETLKEQNIPYTQAIADEDGIGGAVVDNCKGIQGFVANSSALENPNTKERENYANLKSQSSYLLADKINKHQMAVDYNNLDFYSEVPSINQETWKDMFIEELEQIKSKDKDKDTKLKVISKDEVIEKLGRSPDFSDTALMRSRLDYPSTFKIKKVKVHQPVYKGYGRSR